MDSLVKQVTFLGLVADSNAVPRKCSRIELKGVRSGHWRLYMSTPEGASSDEIDALRKAARDSGIILNTFETGGPVTALTFVDGDEGRG